MVEKKLNLTRYKEVLTIFTGVRTMVHTDTIYGYTLSFNKTWRMNSSISSSFTPVQIVPFLVCLALEITFFFFFFLSPDFHELWCSMMSSCLIIEVKQQ